MTLTDTIIYSATARDASTIINEGDGATREYPQYRVDAKISDGHGAWIYGTREELQVIADRRKALLTAYCPDCCDTCRLVPLSSTELASEYDDDEVLPLGRCADCGMLVTRD